MGRLVPALVLLGLLGCRVSAPQGPLAAGSQPAVGSQPVTETTTPVAAQPLHSSTQSLPPIDTYARLLPDTLPLVMGIDIAGLRGTKFWAENYGLIERNQADTLEPLKRCGLGQHTWWGLLLGTDPEHSDATLVMVVVARGIGQPATLDCLATRITVNSEGTAPWTRRSDGRTFEMPDGHLMLVVDINTVVVAASEVAPAVQLRIQSGGRSALDPSLQPALARADVTKHLWAVGRIAEKSGGRALAGNVGTPQDFASWIDFSFGVRAFVALGVESPSAAVEVQRVFGPQIKSMGGMLPQLGIPATVMESVRMGTWGSAFTIEIAASPRELEQMQQEVMKSILGEPAPEARPALAE